MNCRSIKNKVPDLAAVIDEYNPDIIFGTESWLNADIPNNEIFPNTYTIFRKDRTLDCHGGGVFQAIKKEFIVTHRKEFDSECEIVWTHCQLASKKSKSFYLASFYWSNSTDLQSLDGLNDSLLKLGDKLMRHNVLVAGDFNAPDINWETEATIINNSTSEKLLDIINEHDLLQLVREPTRRHD